MFLQRRMRRVRSRTIQPLLCETTLSRNDLVAPLFVDETATTPKPIASMPGQFRYPIDGIAGIAGKIWDRGIKAVLLFGIPAHKDEAATSAYDPEGVVQQAVRRIKAACPGMVVITDVCACEYTSHGHCGIVGGNRCGGKDLLNDESLLLMNRIAASHAEAGADIVAPSCMLDGMVRSIRTALDDEGYEDVLIMSYSTKFSSALYGPFREAAESGLLVWRPHHLPDEPGKRPRSLPRVPARSGGGRRYPDGQAGRPYLDVLAEIATLGLPVAAFQVSGEYAMIKAAAERGWIDEKATVLETLTCIKRAGADLIITYFACDASGWLK